MKALLLKVQVPQGGRRKEEERQRQSQQQLTDSLSITHEEHLHTISPIMGGGVGGNDIRC